MPFKPFPLLCHGDGGVHGAALDPSLARLKDSREELTKAWLRRVCERASLEQIERMPSDRLVGEVSQLIAAVASALGGDEAEAAASQGQARRLVTRLAALRGGMVLGASDLAHDLADLHTELVAALHRELGAADAGAFGESVERLAAIFGDIQAAAAEELLDSRSRELEELASTDPLTGLYNLRFLHQHANDLLEAQRRYGEPFAILILDVDDLKHMNDSFGHAAGNRALQAVAATIRKGIRALDRPVRTGGDEFCVLAPHQTAEEGRALAQRLGTAVENAEAPEGVSIGVSIGVASCPEHGIDVEQLLESADRAMYRAKGAGGRVAVGVAQEEKAPPQLRQAAGQS